MIIQYNDKNELELLSDDVDLKIDKGGVLWYKLISRDKKNYINSNIALNQDYSENDKYKVLINTYVSLSQKLKNKNTQQKPISKTSPKKSVSSSEISDEQRAGDEV
jgi:hypothetical protein